MKLRMSEIRKAYGGKKGGRIDEVKNEQYNKDVWWKEILEG